MSLFRKAISSIKSRSWEESTIQEESWRKQVKSSDWRQIMTCCFWYWSGNNLQLFCCVEEWLCWNYSEWNRLAHNILFLCLHWRRRKSPGWWKEQGMKHKSTQKTLFSMQNVWLVVASTIMSFKVVDRDDLPCMEVVHRGETRTLAPEVVSSMVLRKLKEDAGKLPWLWGERCINHLPQAYFNDDQRFSHKEMLVV